MNNYRGYLLKFGDTVFPNHLFQEFSSTPDQRQDVNSERDNLGTLHRYVLPNGKTSIEFSTHIMDLDEKIEAQNIIKSNAVGTGIPEERKVYVTYWNDETNSYDTAWFYVPDVKYTIMDATATTILYAPITVELIEY